MSDSGSEVTSKKGWPWWLILIALLTSVGGVVAGIAIDSMALMLAPVGLWVVILIAYVST